MSRKRNWVIKGYYYELRIIGAGNTKEIKQSYLSVHISYHILGFPKVYNKPRNLIDHQQTVQCTKQCYKKLGMFWPLLSIFVNRA